MGFRRDIAVVGLILGLGLLGNALPASALPPLGCAVDSQIAAIGKPSVGLGIINSTGIGQTSRIGAQRSQLRLFFVRITNTGTQADSLILHASITAPSTAVLISDGSVNATADASLRSYETSSVPPGTVRSIVLWMRPLSSGPGGTRSITLNTRCKTGSSPSDTVIGQLTVR